ncbi:MAG: alpha/beta hydrolase [Thermoplasmatota archaeon]
MRGWLALLLIVPMLSGCLSFLEDDEPEPMIGPASDVDDPSMVTVDGVAVHNHPTDGGGQDRITSFDGTQLPYVIYEPLASRALPDGSQPRFPVVVFVHGFGYSKEMWLCPPMGDPGQPPLPDDPCPFTNLLQKFAEAGIIAVAYDTRGFGQATGQVTVAGEAEMADLDAVIDFVADRFPVNGKVGVTGISYGGGHAMHAWAFNPKVTTVAAHQGWVDLYEALLPGNVPKVEWDLALIGQGTATSGAQLHPMVYEWAANGIQRTNLADVEAALDARSVLDAIATDKPLLICNALQDSLFHQTQDVLDGATGFTRVVVYEGGHGTMDAECWDKTLAWFEYFLRGVDTGVDAWPALETVDASGGDAITFDELPDITLDSYYLREPQLTTYAPSNTTFNVQQRALNNPFAEPSVVWDQVGMPNQALPYSMRNDPTAVFFEAGAYSQSEVILGAPSLELVLDGDNQTAFQVAVQLLAVAQDDSSIILSRGAYAHVPGVTPEIDDRITVDLHYTKADLSPGTRLVLKVGGNDASWYLPLLNGNDLASSNYDVAFTGHSMLTVPLVADA